MANNPIDQGIAKYVKMSARMLNIVNIVCFCFVCFIDSLNTYLQLIIMGFNDDISFDAANKNKNINQAIS